MKKKFKNIIAALAALVLAAALPAGAFALDPKAECGLEVHLAETVAPELLITDVEVKLYRVADVDQTYYYTSIGAFSGFDLKNYKYIKSADDMRKLTEDVSKAAENLKPDVTGTAVKGVAKFDKLSTGLWLVVIDPTEAGEHEYSFSPVLFSLPSLNTDNGSDMYDIVLKSMKPEHKPLYGDLVISKTIETFGQPATVVFQVEATVQEEGKTKNVYSNVVSITFEGPDTKEKVIAKKIPLGADVTVTEVYSGPGYTPVTETTKLVHFGWQLDDKGDWKLDDSGKPILLKEIKTEFLNKHDTTTKGSSVENYFERGEDGGFIWGPIYFNH